MYRRAGDRRVAIRRQKEDAKNMRRLCNQWSSLAVRLGENIEDFVPDRFIRPLNFRKRRFRFGPEKDQLFTQDNWDHRRKLHNLWFQEQLDLLHNPKDEVDQEIDAFWESEAAFWEEYYKRQEEYELRREEQRKQEEIDECWDLHDDYPTQYDDWRDDYYDPPDYWDECA